MAARAAAGTSQPARPAVPNLPLLGKEAPRSSADGSTTTSRGGWTSPECSSPRSEANSPTSGWTSPEWTPRATGACGLEPPAEPELPAAVPGAGGFFCWAPHAPPGYWAPVGLQHGVVYQCVPVGAFWTAPVVVGCPAAQEPAPAAPGCWVQAEPAVPGAFPAGPAAAAAAADPARGAFPGSPPAARWEAQAGSEPEAAGLTEEEEQLLERLSRLPAAELGEAAASLRGRVWRLAGSPQGTQLLQQVLLAAGVQERAELVAELEGHVNEAWESVAAAPHANYVLQKCIEVLPPNRCRFICDEMLQGDVARAAQSKFGCRILQRLIEHCRGQDVAPLLDALLAEDTLQALMLSRFGNFVVQCVLEHGPAERRSRVAAALARQEDGAFAKLAENKYASHVVQHAMRHCSEADRRLLVGKVLGVEAKDSKFKRSVYGSFVAGEARKWSKAAAQ
ncbi:unnamed protein product [Prorocentrum cordatum]|uniref:PUM-HD domain-containing protein n=1 Tax=Prorocentrum cordatum TaxID=2364126 RepID=A0ABN9TYI2_9DINO|nr:unnamed protein product [Polarella glacialis]